MVCCRKSQGEAGALVAGGGIAGEFAAHESREPLTDCQTHACAFADFLGGEIGIKNPIQRIGFDAVAGIADRQVQIVSRIYSRIWL